MSSETKSLGQIGYEAYAESTGGKTWDGKPMPTWEEIEARTPHVAKAWEDATRAAGKIAVSYAWLALEDEDSNTDDVIEGIRESARAVGII